MITVSLPRGTLASANRGREDTKRERVQSRLRDRPSSHRCVQNTELSSSNYREQACKRN